jgi:hypothetical protein
MTKNDLLELVDFALYIFEFNVIDSEFQKRLIAFNPDLESDIKSSAITENCSCKNTVLNFFNNNKDIVSEFFIKCISENIVDVEKAEILYRKYSDRNISGRVAKTSIKEWPSFVKNLKNSEKRYSFYSLIKEGDDILVFFS